MKNHLLGVPLMLAAAAGFAQNSLTDAEEAAKIAKAQAERLEYKVREADAQRLLDNAERKAAADAEKAAQEAADKKLADVQAAKKAALELEKGQQELADKQQAALAGASKTLADLSAAATVKDVAVTGTPIETKTLTYRALAPIAKQLATEIANTLPLGALPPPAPAPAPVPRTDKASFILADGINLDSLLAVQVTENSLARLAKKYQSGVKDVMVLFGEIRDSTEATTRSGAGVVLALEGVKAVASVVQSFQTKMSATPHEVTVDPLAVHAALASAWRTNDRLKDIPLVAYSGLSRRVSDTEIGKSVNLLETTQDNSTVVVAEMEAWLAKNKPAAGAVPAPAAKGKPKAAAATTKPVPQSVIDEVSDLLAKLKVTNNRVSDVLMGLSSTSATQPVSLLTLLVRDSHIMTSLSEGASLLSVKAVAGGGNSLATNNLWVGPKLFHSGGVVMAYTVLNQHGTIVAGGVLDSHTGYVRMKRSESAGLGNSWSD